MPYGINISEDKNTIFLQKAGEEVRTFIAVDDIVVDRNYQESCKLCDLSFICMAKVDNVGCEIPCTTRERLGCELDSVYFKEVTNA